MNVPTRKWFLSKARKERNFDVSTGPLGEPRPATRADDARQRRRVAFGRLIELQRRERNLSIEDLAKRTEVPSSEIVELENDVTYLPEPSTVVQLARELDLPEKGLMLLAGLIDSKDGAIDQQALRFAANSKSTHGLSPEEKQALEAFVAVIADSI